MTRPATRPSETPPRPAQSYRPPALLQDIRLLDLLEISGTTLEAGRACGLSQPTVSRRARALVEDFALRPNRRRLVGCCYGTSPAMRLVRLGCRAHRLSAGVARIGADLILQPLLHGCGWLLPAPPRFRPVEGWLELVRQGVLDGALVSGLEFSEPLWGGELELLPLGEPPLLLASASPRRPSGDPQTDLAPGAVLVPNRSVAQGLQQALQRRGLPLITAANSFQTPAQWLPRLERSGLAMVLPALPPAGWWQPLRRQPLPEPLALPVWLALPADWRRVRVLRTAAEQLRWPRP
jgi:hypothetical protein